MSNNNKWLLISEIEPEPLKPIFFVLIDDSIKIGRRSKLSNGYECYQSNTTYFKDLVKKWQYVTFPSLNEVEPMIEDEVEDEDDYPCSMCGRYDDKHMLNCPNNIEPYQELITDGYD